jgi:hypothetical protein
MPGIPALGSWRQEDDAMEVRLGYIETLSQKQSILYLKIIICIHQETSPNSLELCKDKPGHIQILKSFPWQSVVHK